MIVTVTPNPSIDRTLEVDQVRRGAVLRATASHIDAGGKGVNVARALIANGHPALAVLPLGGGDGRLLAGLLADAGIPHRAVPAIAATRSNVTLSEPDGTVTKVNAPGEPLSGEELTALLDSAIDALGDSGAEWLVGCGSLPDGAPADLFATLTERGRTAGAAVAIDTSGAPLFVAVAAQPDLIKPNRSELAALVGRDLPSLGAVIDAAEKIRSEGVGAVLVSLGADGAVLVDGEEPVLAVPPSVIARSDVGAGDTLLAGFLARGASGAAALQQGVAWAAAAVALPGTSVPGPGAIDLAAVQLLRGNT